ncbi:hypothetical protein BDR06DRAFT_729599 [Suillus hirtellus]|nr:hypothetical protein BDR06DRAFT_729599 [Suillus hirtellus]
MVLCTSLPPAFPSLVIVSFACPFHHVACFHILLHFSLLSLLFPCMLSRPRAFPDFVFGLPTAPRPIGVIPACNATIPCHPFSSAVVTIQMHLDHN